MNPTIGVTSPLRVSDFRWFFIGEVVNTAGSSMASIALAFVTLAIHDSAGSLGLVIAAWTACSIRTCGS
jgi:hypothetical protein